MSESNERTLDAMLYTTEFEGLSQYRVPYSRELEGKSYVLVFDDRYEMMVSFPSRDKIMFSENGGDLVIENCHVLKAEDTVYFLMVDRRKTTPRSGFMLIIDLKTNLVTGNFVQQGTRPDFPSLVTRYIRFGAIKEGDRPLPADRHHYTDDLIGRKIEWTYNPNFKITHVYLSNDSYCFALNGEMKKEMMERRGIEDGMDVTYKPVKEPSIFLKIRENVYVFSWIEENGGSGTEGLVVINTDRMTDVGCFFGNNPQGEPEGYMFSAYGHWVNEHLEEEDF